MPGCCTRLIGGPLDRGLMTMPERPDPNSEFDFTREGPVYRYQWIETQLNCYWEYVREVTGEVAWARIDESANECEGR